MTGVVYMPTVRSSMLRAAVMLVTTPCRCGCWQVVRVLTGFLTFFLDIGRPFGKVSGTMLLMVWRVMHRIHRVFTSLFVSAGSDTDKDEEARERLHHRVRSSSSGFPRYWG